jgi:hypothetical protein
MNTHWNNKKKIHKNDNVALDIEHEKIIRTDK